MGLYDTGRFYTPQNVESKTSKMQWNWSRYHIWDSEDTLIVAYIGIGILSTCPAESSQPEITI